MNGRKGHKAVQPVKRLGRPTLRTPRIEKVILGRIAQGRSLRKILKNRRLPSPTTVARWLTEDKEFREHYREARDIQADGFFDEQIDIADEATPETAQVARLRIDARKWVMGRINAKKYGEKSAEINVSTAVHNHFSIPLERQEQLQARRQELLGNAT